MHMVPRLCRKLSSVALHHTNAYTCDTTSFLTTRTAGRLGLLEMAFLQNSNSPRCHAFSFRKLSSSSSSVGYFTVERGDTTCGRERPRTTKCPCCLVRVDKEHAHQLVQRLSSHPQCAPDSRGPEGRRRKADTPQTCENFQLGPHPEDTEGPHIPEAGAKYATLRCLDGGEPGRSIMRRHGTHQVPRRTSTKIWIFSDTAHAGSRVPSFLGSWASFSSGCQPGVRVVPCIAWSFLGSPPFCSVRSSHCTEQEATDPQSPKGGGQRACHGRGAQPTASGQLEGVALF